MRAESRAEAVANGCEDDAAKDKRSVSSYYTHEATSEHRGEKLGQDTGEHVDTAHCRRHAVDSLEVDWQVVVCNCARDGSAYKLHLPVIRALKLLTHHGSHQDGKEEARGPHDCEFHHRERDERFVAFPVVVRSPDEEVARKATEQANHCCAVPSVPAICQYFRGRRNAVCAMLTRCLPIAQQAGAWLYWARTRGIRRSQACCGCL